MKPAASFALACACLALAGPARAGIGVGVADNTLLGNADGGAAYLGVLNDIGLRELRLPVKWDPARPTEIENRREIKALLPTAAVRGVNVAFSIQPGSATAITSSPEAASRFVAFEQHVARTFPTVKDIIVGNEPNQPYFWQPQFDARGTERLRRCVRGAARGELRRTEGGESGDRRHRPRALFAWETTIGGRRGTSRRRRSSSSSGMGAAYRASGRTRPLMDELAYHPYPRRDTDRLPRASCGRTRARPNLDRDQAGGLGRIPRHGAEDVRGRPARAAGRGRDGRSPFRGTGSARTSAPRRSSRRPRPRRRRSTRRSSATRRATRASTRSSSSGCGTSRISRAGRQG